MQKLLQRQVKFPTLSFKHFLRMSFLHHLVRLPLTLILAFLMQTCCASCAGMFLVGTLSMFSVGSSDWQTLSFGEMPKNLGDFQPIAPGKAWDSVVRLHKGVSTGGSKWGRRWNKYHVFFPYKAIAMRCQQQFFPANEIENRANCQEIGPTFPR